MGEMSWSQTLVGCAHSWREAIRSPGSYGSMQKGSQDVVQSGCQTSFTSSHLHNAGKYERHERSPGGTPKPHSPDVKSSFPAQLNLLRLEFSWIYHPHNSDGGERRVPAFFSHSQHASVQNLGLDGLRGPAVVLQAILMRSQGRPRRLRKGSFANHARPEWKKRSLWRPALFHRQPHPSNAMVSHHIHITRNICLVHGNCPHRLHVSKGPILCSTYEPYSAANIRW